MGTINRANQDGKLRAHHGEGAQGLHVGSEIVGGSLLQLQEEGAETSQQVDLAGDIVNGDDMESVLFPGGEVAGIQGRKGGRDSGHFLFNVL